mgnify:FL=1
MCKFFNSYEEMRITHPLNSDHNQSYLVHKVYEYVLTKQDLENARLKHPDGWLDKTDHKWFYYDIVPSTWYDHYLWDGEKWCLGMDSWDGIQYAEEPTWGIQRACNIQRTEFGVFKTKAEAIDYKNKKLKERLEF